MEFCTLSWYNRSCFEADKAKFIDEGFRIEQEEEVKNSYGDPYWRAVAVKGSVEEVAQEVRRRMPGEAGLEDRVTELERQVADLMSEINAFRWAASVTDGLADFSRNYEDRYRDRS